jgi:GUN4-like/Pentapeptide repeats (8 copies)
MKAQDLLEKYKNGVRDFRRVELERANLAWSDLSDADFRGANLQHSNLKGAILHHVNFSEGANLAFADLSSAELINTDLRGTNLQGANLSESQLNSIIDEHTRLPKGFQARLQPDHGSEESESLAYQQQIEQLTQESLELQKQLGNERQQSQLVLAQLQQKNNLENVLQNLEKQQEQAQQTIKTLTSGNDNLKQSLLTAEGTQAHLESRLTSCIEEIKQLSSALQTAEACIAKLQQEPSILDKGHKYSHRGQRQQGILDKAHEWPKLRCLIELLAAKKWRKADEETHFVILEIAGLSRKNKSGLEKDYIYRFPVTVLQAIDQLWLSYSSGHFGFSVQASIWQSAGGNDTEQVLQTVGDYLGWYKDGQWCWYDRLHFTLDAPEGHLPARAYDQWQGRGVVFRPTWTSLYILNNLNRSAVKPH